MSLKAELETWAAALKAYDDEDFEGALDLFSEIADSSKILCNMGLIYATLGEHEAAVERFMEATKLDQYLAVAYFQSGVSNFLLARFELAQKNFDDALLYLRGNQAIYYEQLGLDFRLYSAEVLFNKGLSLIYMGEVPKGLGDMEEARREKATEEHNVIDDAIADRGEGYTVFSIPVGVLYRPSEKKLKNSVTKDYLGKAKLVASSDPTDDVTEFSGAVRLKLGISPSGIYLDRPDVNTDTQPVLRSATFPAPASRRIDGPKSAGVERANTTPSGGRENSNVIAAKLTSPKDYGPPSAGVARSNTQIVPARPSPNVAIGGPARGLSIKRPSIAPDSTKPPPIPPPEDSPLTEFYAGYANVETPPVPPRSGSISESSDRIWARNNGIASHSSRATNSLGSGSAMRNTRRTGSRAQRGNYSPHDDEEEGYGSDNYEGGCYDMSLIRVKIHYHDDVRGMTMTQDIKFLDFMDKVCSKFKKQTGELAIKFADEDGGKISLRDESDFEMAIETARAHANGKPEGKLELWCRDHY